MGAAAFSALLIASFNIAGEYSRPLTPGFYFRPDSSVERKTIVNHVNHRSICVKQQPDGGHQGHLFPHMVPNVPDLIGRSFYTIFQPLFSMDSRGVSAAVESSRARQKSTPIESCNGIEPCDHIIERVGLEVWHTLYSRHENFW